MAGPHADRGEYPAHVIEEGCSVGPTIPIIKDIRFMTNAEFAATILRRAADVIDGGGGGDGKTTYGDISDVCCHMADIVNGQSCCDVDKFDMIHAKQAMKRARLFTNEAHYDSKVDLGGVLRLRISYAFTGVI